MEFTTNDKYKDNLILEKTFKFSRDIILYSGELDAERRFAVSNQIIRSGTSIGANVKESQNAESKKDFLHKLKIAQKEADETEYWLFLCKSIPDYPECDHLIEQLESITKILNKIVGTTRRNNV